MPSHGHNVQFANKDATKTIFADWNGSGSTSWTVEGLGATNIASNPLTAMSTGGSGSHYHSISRTSATTGSEGSGTSVNVLNPYYVVYTWTRTV